MSSSIYYKDQRGKLWANPTKKAITKNSLVAIDTNTAGKILKSINELTVEQHAVSAAQSWAKTELSWVDIQLKYNVSGDTARSKFTNEILYAYAIKCRNYVQNIDGVLTIMTDKPSRPQ